MNYAVLFDKVSKSYRCGVWGLSRRFAVQDVSFAVPSGTVFGLAGPNRAGKTTLLKLLLSLCRPTNGRVERLGQPTSDIRTLARVGYMHENHAFPKYLTAAEVLYLYGGLSGLSGTDLGQRVSRLLAQVDLADRQHESIRTFSKGMIQRLGLAQALLNDPDLLVLDEPTEGLDLQGRQLLRQAIRELRQRGKTVLIVSHTLSELEQICDRIAVLVQGKIVYNGTVDEIRTLSSDNGQSLECALTKIYEQGCAA